jgi:arylsulfatase
MLHVALALSAVAQETLPRPEPKFQGRIGRNAKESTPDFPKDVKAPAGAPNVLLIMTDDVGFGAASTFGGPIPTPTLDRLAHNGLRYNQFHTTAMCSPTRAALLTGRNHHTCATGTIMEFGTGYPGYNTVMSKGCGTVGEILRQNGYNTSFFGKCHNVPDWQTSQAGPFDRWPTSQGFEYFYGFLGAETSQWDPALFEGTKPIQKPRGDRQYHFDRDMADHAIAWIRQQHALAPARPFLAYYAPGTAHAPHHAPKEWIARFQGRFDQGWDKVREETFARQKKLGIVPANAALTPRPKEIPAWDSLSADQKRLFAHMMEVYCAALAHCDYHIGRIIEALEQSGQLDNTLVIYIQGDNGPSAEGTLQGLTDELGTNSNGVPEDLEYLLSVMDELGGPKFSNHYPVGWCHAMATPFQWMKQVASHFGGTRNGLVISWPKRIKDAGGLRGQFHHVIDVVPTILDAAGLPEPSMIGGVPQKPIEGVSMLYSFDDAKAASHHQTQYFEMVANRGIYDRGWVACTTPRRLPWVTLGGATDNPADDFAWELYHTDEDFTESVNLARSNPRKLRELQDLWWVEAARHNVLPLDCRFAERANPANRPSLSRDRTTFTYYPGMVRIPEATAPDVKNKSFRITAAVELSSGGAEGILATQGGHCGGWAFLLLDGKPNFVYAFSDQPRHKYWVAAKEKLPAGPHTLAFDFIYDGGGIGKGGGGSISVDGQKVAENHIERTVGNRFSLDETFDVGEDTGTPVVENYVDKMPFRFTGTLKKLVVDLGPSKLTAKQQRELQQMKRAAVIATE